MPTEIIAVLDYGTSNLRSVAKALQNCCGPGQQVVVSGVAAELDAADRVVFPGQGAIGQCMSSLQRLGLDTVVRRCIMEKPFLGICLGLQSLVESSDEDGDVRCLGIVPGKVVRFVSTVASSVRYKIPHMGWNNVMPVRDHPLWHGIDSGERFYFVHSYYVAPSAADVIAGKTEYITDFTSAVAIDNLFAVQFHPEKSQRAGLRLLKNFLVWRP